MITRSLNYPVTPFFSVLKTKSQKNRNKTNQGFSQVFLSGLAESEYKSKHANSLKFSVLLFFFF